jgi:hypothetical protein
MGRYNTTDPPRRDPALVTAAEWFGGGQRIPYDPESARADRAGGRRDAGGALSLRARGRRGADCGHGVARAAARVPGRLLAFPGGHLTTSEHPDLLATAIRDIAVRHGVGTPAPARR